MIHFRVTLNAELESAVSLQPCRDSTNQTGASFHEARVAITSQSFATAYANSRPNAWADRLYLSFLLTPIDCDRENESWSLTDLAASRRTRTRRNII